MLGSGCAGRRLCPLAERIARSLVALLDGIDLRRAEAARRFRPGALQPLPGAREDECGGIEFRSARPQIVNYAIDASVEAIAGRKKRAGK
jgi:hypothetical protein